MSSWIAGLLAFWFLTAPARADVVLPLNTMRPQVGVSSCWAYAAAHMTEARALYRDGITLAIDIQKTFYYWQVQDRLLNSFQRKKPSYNLMAETGYTANFWHLLAWYGLEIFKAEKGLPAPDYDYPRSRSFNLTPKYSQNRFNSYQELVELERELINSSMTLAQARHRIKEVVDRTFVFAEPPSEETRWIDDKMKTKDSYRKTMGNDFNTGGGYGQHSFVLITNYFFNRPEWNNSWLRYDDDRHWAIGKKDKYEILSIARASLDKGWPTTLESDAHATTVIGYKNEGGKFYYAIADSLENGMDWWSQDSLEPFTDITVFYPAVRHLLPPIDEETLSDVSSAEDYPSVWIPPKGLAGFSR
jgi:hypothetical protein